MTCSGKRRQKSPKKKLAEIPMWCKVFDCNFWDISINKILYYIKSLDLTISQQFKINEA